MNHHTTPEFWQRYNALSFNIRRLADKNFQLLKSDPTHPSLQLKNIEGLWSVRVGIQYRALAYREVEDYYWFWIGSHADYDKFLP